MFVIIGIFKQTFFYDLSKTIRNRKDKDRGEKINRKWMEIMQGREEEKIITEYAT